MEPEDKVKVIQLIIDYIYLNFKKVSGFDPNEQLNLDDEALIARRETRRKANEQRDIMFGPRKSKFYDVGVDLGENKGKKKKAKM